MNCVVSNLEPCLRKFIAGVERSDREGWFRFPHEDLCMFIDCLVMPREEVIHLMSGLDVGKCGFGRPATQLMFVFSDDLKRTLDRKTLMRMTEFGTRLDDLVESHSFPKYGCALRSNRRISDLLSFCKDLIMSLDKLSDEDLEDMMYFDDESQKRWLDQKILICDCMETFDEIGLHISDGKIKNVRFVDSMKKVLTLDDLCGKFPNGHWPRSSETDPLESYHACS